LIVFKGHGGPAAPPRQHLAKYVNNDSKVAVPRPNPLTREEKHRLMRSGRGKLPPVQIADATVPANGVVNPGISGSQQHDQWLGTGGTLVCP
jgi:hypothetical protein